MTFKLSQGCSDDWSELRHWARSRWTLEGLWVSCSELQRCVFCAFFCCFTCLVPIDAQDTCRSPSRKECLLLYRSNPPSSIVYPPSASLHACIRLLSPNLPEAISVLHVFRVEQLLQPSSCRSFEHMHVTYFNITPSSHHFPRPACASDVAEVFSSRVSKLSPILSKRSAFLPALCS